MENSDKPQAKFSSKLWLTLVGVGILLLLGIVSLSLSRSAKVVTLSDGSICRLAAVTYGKEHKYSSVGKELLARLPKPILKVLGLPTTSASPAKLSTTNDSIGIWIVRQGIPPGVNQDFGVYITDSEGRMGGDCNLISSSSRGNDQVKGFAFKAFPRRNKTLLVRLTHWNAGNREVAGVFQVENPVWGQSFPEWKPEPLPVSRTNGDVEFTLTNLRGGVRMDGITKNTTNLLEGNTHAEFEMRQGGQLLTNWQPVRVIVQDATGNELENTSWSSSSQGGRQRMTFQGHLDPTESAWKLRVEFSRTSGFAPEETWTVPITYTNIIATSAWGGGMTNTLARTNLCGVTVEFLGIYRQAAFQPVGQAYVQFRLSSLPGNHRFTCVSLSDEQGHALRSSGTGRNNNLYQFQVENVPPSGSLNIIVAVHPSRFVEFLAKPTRVEDSSK